MPHNHRNTRKHTSRRGFSLLEVIITIVVLGLLASIAFVGYGAVVTRAATASTEASLLHIDRAVDVTHAMRTATDGGIRTDADFATAAYGTDGTGDSEIMSSTGTWDLSKATADMTDGFDQSIVYYVLDGNVTGMAKTVIDSSPDGDRWHLSFLKSSPAQTVTWSAWCDIDPADLLTTNYPVTGGEWPHPDCQFEGSFQNNPGNGNPAVITDEGSATAQPSSIYISAIEFTGVATDIQYTFHPVTDETGETAHPTEEVVKSDKYALTSSPAAPQTAGGLEPGVWYITRAELLFNDQPETSKTVQNIVRPYTNPTAPTVTAELTTSQLDGDGNVTPDFDATVTVSWGDIYTNNNADTGFAATNDMNFRVDQSLNGGNFSEVTSTETPGHEIVLDEDGTYSVVVDAAAGKDMVFRVVAFNAHGLPSNDGEGIADQIEVGDVPAYTPPVAPTVGPNTLGQNAAYGYDFAWSADSNSTSVEYRLNGGSWLPLSGTDGNITGFSSPFATVTVEVRAKVYDSNDYGFVESDWASATSDFTFEGPADIGDTATAPTITTGDTVFNYTYAFDFDWNNVGADEQQCSYNGGTFTTCSGITWTGTGSAGSTHTLQVQVRNLGTPHPIYGGGEPSAWVKSNIATVNFGSPVAKPEAPSAPASGGIWESDNGSTPRVQGNHPTDTSTYKHFLCVQSVSGNNSTWNGCNTNGEHSADTNGSWGSSAASFNRTYVYSIKRKHCVAGNSYNTTATVCSDMSAARVDREYVGSPLATPGKPSAPATPNIWEFDNDSTPRVKATHTVDTSTYKHFICIQSVANGNGSWNGCDTDGEHSADTDGSWGSSPASFNRTYVFSVKRKHCIQGNSYNDNAVLCSVMSNGSVDRQYIGSPLATPSAPGTPSISFAHAQKLSSGTPTASVSSSGATTIDVDKYNGSSWASSATINGSSGTASAYGTDTSKLRARARKCITGNSYNNGATLCSNWSGWRQIDTYLWPYITSQRVEVAHRGGGGSAESKKRIVTNFNRNGNSGALTMHYYASSHPSSGWYGCRGNSSTGCPWYSAGTWGSGTWSETAIGPVAMYSSTWVSTKVSDNSTDPHRNGSSGNSWNASAYKDWGYGNSRGYTTVNWTTW